MLGGCSTAVLGGLLLWAPLASAQEGREGDRPEGEPVSQPSTSDSSSTTMPSTSEDASTTPETGALDIGNFDLGYDTRELFGLRADNIFLVKVNYWLNF